MKHRKTRRHQSKRKTTQRRKTVRHRKTVRRIRGGVISEIRNHNEYIQRKEILINDLGDILDRAEFAVDHLPPAAVGAEVGAEVAMEFIDEIRTYEPEADEIDRWSRDVQRRENHEMEDRLNDGMDIIMALFGLLINNNNNNNATVVLSPTKRIRSNSNNNNSNVNSNINMLN
jgi:hypothetical protein